MVNLGNLTQKLNCWYVEQVGRSKLDLWHMVVVKALCNILDDSFYEHVAAYFLLSWFVYSYMSVGICPFTLSVIVCLAMTVSATLRYDVLYF